LRVAGASFTGGVLFFSAAMADTTDAKTKDLRERAQKLLAASYFDALGVSRTASPEEVKRAFIETVKAWHPDRVPPGMDDLKPLFGKVFARLELARATVSDPARRARYIEELAKPSGSMAAAEGSSGEAMLEFRKAEVLLKKNDTTQALEHLHRAVQLAPANGDFRTLLVWVQAKPDSSLDRLRELVAELDKLIAKDRQNERAYFYRAQLRKRLGLTKEALSDFSRAADLNPRNIDAVREVRLHNVRKEKAEGAKKEEEDSAVGFFKKLFKR
jgi:curved DNA-binding protein CbpA